MAVLACNHYMRYFSFLFGGRLSGAVGNDDVHRSARWRRRIRTGINLSSKNVLDLPPVYKCSNQLSQYKILLWNYHMLISAFFFLFFFSYNLPKSFNYALSVLFKHTNWGELSSESGASCLRARFSWGELSWGELSMGRVAFGASCHVSHRDDVRRLVCLSNVRKL